MGKFILLQDISRCPCYSNINARLLYLHIACQVDISTYNYAQSLRHLAAETGLTVETVRHALRLLVRDGLITTQQAPQQAPQGTPQGRAQLITHLHIVNINDLREPCNTAAMISNNTANNTSNNTAIPTQNKNYNKKTFTHANACEMAKKWVGLLAAELSISTDQADNLCVDFLRRMSIKGKEWESEGDCLAHLISWSEKAVPRGPRAAVPRKSARQLDDEARQAEYQRTKEAAANQDQREKDWEELQKLKRWRDEWEKKGQTDELPALDAEIARLSALFTK